MSIKNYRINKVMPTSITGVYIRCSRCKTDAKVYLSIANKEAYFCADHAYDFAMVLLDSLEEEAKANDQK